MSRISIRLMTLSLLIVFFTYFQRVEGYTENVERTYYPSGNICTEAYYENGKLNGPFRRYYDDGTLGEEANYTDGKLDGRSIAYYKNGVVQAVIIYQYGDMLQCWLFNMKGGLLTNSCLSLTLKWKYGSWPYPTRRN